MKNNILMHVRKMKMKGISTTEIIKQSKIGRTSFYEIMNGRQIPKIDTAIKISVALEANVEDVFPEIKK
jgi:DNA-binding XRE family transcriptional regulator